MPNPRTGCFTEVKEWATFDNQPGATLPDLLRQAADWLESHPGFHTREILFYEYTLGYHLSLTQKTIKKED